MKPIIQDFTEKENLPQSSFRTIILFGRNVSTYKFALAETLLTSAAISRLTYGDIRDDFIKNLYRHYLKNPNQYQGGSNSITKAFDSYAKDNDWDKLVNVAEKNIYNNVFDAFHNVGGSSIREEYILFEHDRTNKQLILSENMHEIIERKNVSSQLLKENESRWNIVEEAWKSKLSPNMLVYNSDKNVYSVIEGHERVNLRSAVDILLPYQHGRCFYCNKHIDVYADQSDHDFPDVDHVIPFSAFNQQVFLETINPNGLWNLVIACNECNRGTMGKFEAPPEKVYFKKLVDRNVLFTQEHRHSLKNTILLSLGAQNYKEVIKRMQTFIPYIDLLVGWSPKYIYDN